MESVGSGSLVVGDRTVVVSGETEIVDREGRSIGLWDIEVGSSADVSGYPQSDGSVLARRIKIWD